MKKTENLSCLQPLMSMKKVKNQYPILKIICCGKPYSNLNPFQKPINAIEGKKSFLFVFTMSEECEEEKKLSMGISVNNEKKTLIPMVKQRMLRYVWCKRLNIWNIIIEKRFSGRRFLSKMLFSNHKLFLKCWFLHKFWVLKLTSSRISRYLIPSK